MSSNLKYLKRKTADLSRRAQSCILRLGLFALCTCGAVPGAHAGLEIINGATFTVTNDAVLETSGSVVMGSGGVLDAAGAAPGRIRLSGNWNNQNGLFTHGTSSVTFYDLGASSITGNTTFYVLNCLVPGKTLFFQNGSTQGIVNVANIVGSIGNEIQLRPTLDSATWYIRSLSSPTVHFVNVQNSSAMHTIVTTKFSIDAGGNNNFWIFDEIGVLVAGNTYYHFGLWDLSSSTVSASSFTLQNIGNVLEDFKIRATTSTQDTPWSLQGAPGTDQMVIYGGFSPSRPNPGDFGAEDVIDYQDQTPNATKFAIGSSTGTEVAVDERRHLWIRLDTPLLTSTTDQQRLEVTITGQKSP